MSAAEQKIVQIFRERADDAGAAKDVLRHSEPLMPDPVRRGIARAWKRSKEYRTAWKAAQTTNRRVFVL